MFVVFNFYNTNCFFKVPFCLEVMNLIVTDKRDYLRMLQERARNYKLHEVEDNVSCPRPNSIMYSLFVSLKTMYRSTIGWPTETSLFKWLVLGL